MTVSNWQQIESDGGLMPVHVSVPEGSGSFPGLVVIQHLAADVGFFLIVI